MSTNYSKLKEISSFLGLEQLSQEIEHIESRENNANANILIPLVGEFSSGKTTLINALTDSKQLETASKPTTATIYEVHFGCDKCRATILNEKNECIEVEDISNLKNDKLTETKVVTIFDTAKKVSPSIILVDTPGLSSPDPKHKQTLVNFLPKADGIFLIIDINQQITRSLTDFVETMKLSMRPIFLVLTKADTKSPKEIEAAKKYISENCKIPLKQVAVVSASTDNLSEFYSLLDEIQKSKNEILQKVDSQRIKNITNILIEQVEELMTASNSDKELDESIRQSQYELEKINREINRLVESVADDIENQDRTTARKFEDTIFSKLNNLVIGKSNNFDNEAISIINSTSALLMNEYKTEVQNILCNKARSQKDADSKVFFGAIDSLDMSNVQMSGLNYNLNLNTMGHEYDGWIKNGIIATAAIGAIVAVAATGGAATGAVASSATAANVIDVADTATDVGNIISNRKTVNRIEKAVGFASKTSEKYSSFVNTNQQMGQQMGSDKGMIESMVGFVTDKVMSKPQRARAIRDYIDTSLAPEFKSGLKSISTQLVSAVHDHIQSQASQIIEQKTASLNQLKTELKEKKELFEEKLNKLREYHTSLLTF